MLRAFFIVSFGRITKSNYLCGMKTNNGHNVAPGSHKMGRRKDANCYYLPGLYHVTLKVNDEWGAVLGRMAGDINIADGLPGAPHVELTSTGHMVQEELTQSIKRHYPMVEVMEYIVMPEHLHVLLIVHSRMESCRGRSTHLGHVIAGFKKGCNRRFWELMGMRAEMAQRGKPAVAPQGGLEFGGCGKLEMGKQGGGLLPASALGVRQSVSPFGYKVPSRQSSGRMPLFAEGYVDVMPVNARQLQTQLAYIRQNPRSRLLRTSNRAWLQPQRGGINTALSVKALLGYLQRECSPWQITTEIAEDLCQRLLTESNHAVAKGEKQNTGAQSSIAPTTHSPIITCDSYGDRSLLEKELLPVICHRRYKALFEQQKTLCLKAAARGAVLVSPRIAKGEQEIIDAALDAGAQVVVIADNGMPDIFHPSGTKTDLCASGKLLIVSPWIYSYRRADTAISVAECKVMNCVAQALCRRRDDWWKENERMKSERMKNEE